MAKSKENPTLMQSGAQSISVVVKAVKRKPAVWAAVAAGLLLVVAVGVLLAVRGAPDWEILDTVAHTAVGKPTLAELKAQTTKEPKNGGAWLEYGHGLWDAKNTPAALKAYDRALTLDASLASSRVVENLTSCFGAPCQASASAVIVEHKLKDSGDKLVELTGHSQYRVRIAAVNTLERMGLSSRVDYVALYKRDLASSDCDVKRYAVEKLVGSPGTELEFAL